jgi:hypothetical protein
MRLRVPTALALAAAVSSAAACFPKTEPESWHLGAASGAGASAGSATGSPAPAASPASPCPAARVEDLAAAIVDALRRGDEAAFDACVASAGDIQTLGAQATHAGAPHYAELLGAGTDRARASYTEARSRMSGACGGAEAAAFSRAVFHPAWGDGILGTDTRITITCRGDHYELMLDDCVKTPRGWILADKAVWIGDR